MQYEDRYIRQRDIVPADRLASCTVTVVGVGAIGRQVALQLAAMGASRLQLIDHDVVELVNLSCQGYREAELNQPKVIATAAACRELNHAIEVEAQGHRFRRSLPVGNILFCCVDSIETRRLIWNTVKQGVGLFVDGRMTAEVIRVLVAADCVGRERYPDTLFDARQAFTGSCTSKSTIFTANIAAGLMLAQFSRWLRRMPVDPDLTLNLLAGELTPAA